MLLASGEGLSRAMAMAAKAALWRVLRVWYLPLAVPIARGRQALGDRPGAGGGGF